MQAIKPEADADDVIILPPEPFQSAPELCLSQSPPIVYYDYQAIHELYGKSVIQMWNNVPQAKVLLLRLATDRWDQQPDLGDPVLTCFMARLYLPRNENRNAHLVAYFKPTAAEFAIKFAKEINSVLSFKELVTDVLPAMNADTVVIADPAEVDSLQNFNNRGPHIWFV
ncbi:hypothetical protein M3Y99_00414300 [Aphelenchoides fujianensis]|nr:hypothetical protein M3Y99_00414300 [Aphelenchoides fujianensis]